MTFFQENTPESVDQEALGGLAASPVKATKEEKDFDSLDADIKLKRLENLVEQSKVYSNIIAERLFESTVTAQKEKGEPSKKEGETPLSDEPVKKRQKRATRARTKQSRQSTIVFHANDSKISIESSAKKRQIEESQTHNENTRQPTLISGCKMRDYQLDGMEWLITLYKNGLNGILADEMGLGKTIQCIALLAYLIDQGSTGPFLVVCPLSTTGNWAKEFAKFAPSIRYLNYVGYKDVRANLRKQWQDKNKFTVVITSYEIAIRDRVHLGKFNWQYLIVDEGHRLKNHDCLLIKELKKLNCGNRLLITGTPLQNNLNELWSLLNFILPDIFRDVELFNQWFNFDELKEINKDNDEKISKIINSEIEKNLISNLHTILKPFLLRRLKNAVVKDLPPKREYIIYGSLTVEQKNLYKAALDRNLKIYMFRKAFMDYMTINKTNIDSKKIALFINEKLSEIENRGETIDSNVAAASITQSESRVSTRNSALAHQSKKRLSRHDVILNERWDIIKREVEHKKYQNLMMQLRLICDSPYLFSFPWEDELKIDERIIANSGKLQILDQLLPKLLETKHKVLIFSQFTKMLDLIHDWLDFKKIKVCRIDGETAQDEREEQIKQFNETDYEVFLLSTRAGGLGINLTAADTVILFDSDWNPQVDLQAMDRVHRIGQTKPVIIYRLAISNTIEQVLLAKADSKRKLEKMVIQMGAFENLNKLMNQDLKLTGKKVNYESEDIIDELNKLLNGEAMNFSGNVMDNILNNDEINELLDRTQEAYTGQNRKGRKFKHITIFETVNTMK